MSQKARLSDIKLCVFIFIISLSKMFPNLRRIQLDNIENLQRSSCKVTAVLSKYNETWIFSIDFPKKYQKTNFIKIRPGGAELFHADRQTDRHDKANSRHSQFCERSDQTLTFASHSKKEIQMVVRPIRSPRQQWPPRRTKNGDLSIVFSVASG